MRDLARAMPWAWTALVAVGSLAVYAAQLGAPDGDPGQLAYAGLPTTYTALGSLIVTRRHGHRIGWLLFGIGTAGLLTAASLVLMPVEPPATLSPGQLFALVWWSLGWWLGLLLPLLLLLFLFPTGRFLSRRWSWAGWVAAVFATQSVLSSMFGEELGPESGAWTVANPIGFLALTTADEGPFWIVFGLSLVSLLVGGLAAIVVRYRRSTALVRTQIKWVVYAATLFALVLGQRLFLPAWINGLTEPALVVSLYLIAVAITVAIVRYRLFDIDRIISRTLGYALVIVTLAAVYAVGAVWLPTQLLGAQPPLFVAASTVAVAALFSPVRRWVLVRVDRRFYRSGYEARRVAGEFGGRLQDEVEVDRVAGNLTSVVQDIMQPSAIAVWMPGRRRDPAG